MVFKAAYATLISSYEKYVYEYMCMQKNVPNYFTIFLT